MKQFLLFVFLSTFAVATINAQPAGILINSGKVEPFSSLGGGQYKSTVLTKTGNLVGLAYSTTQVVIERFTATQIAFPKAKYLLSTNPPLDAYMEPETIAIGSDGKLLIFYSGVLAIQRINADGSFDTSFNHGSSIRTGYGSSHVAILPNGEFILPSSGRNSQGSYINFARFGNHGDILSTSVILVGEYKGITITDLEIGNDGKILLGGFVTGEGATTAEGIMVARLNPDGAPDNTFGSGGVVLSKEGNTVISLSGSTYGKVVVSLNGNKLLRFDNNGSVDATFGIGGLLSLPFQVNENVIQSDGKIIVGGTQNSDFAIARLDDSGNFDQTFGVAGIVTKGFYVRQSGPYGPSYDAVADMAIIGNRLYAYGTANLATYSLGEETAGNSTLHLAYAAPGSTGNQDFGGTLGMEFTVNSPAGITIKQLGAFDHQGDGINGNIRVAVFDNKTRQIVPGLDATITGLADGYTGSYRVKNISAVTLPPGTYVVVAKGYNANELNGNADFGITVIPGDNGAGAISYTGSSRFGTSDGFNYPEYQDAVPVNKYLAGTFQFEVAGSGAANHLAYKAVTNIGNQAFGGTLGMEFTVNSAAGISVNQLGVFDHQGDGINGNIRVAIFNKTMQQIVPGLDATITGLADGYSGNYRVKNIAPVTLTAGTYVVVTKGYNANELNGNADFGTPVIPGDDAGGTISYTGNSLFGTAEGFNYPEYSDAGLVNKYLAGTFQFEVPGMGSTNNLAYKAATNTGNQAFGGTLGMQFTVYTPAGISIKQLGVFDHQGDGINGNIRVAVFNKSTRQIVPGLDVTISGLGDDYLSNYRLKNINPVTLPPGIYVLVTKGYSSTELNGNADYGTPIMSGDNGGGVIGYTGSSLFGTAEGFNYPEYTDAGPPNKYLAGTFQFDVNTTYPSSSYLAYKAATIVGKQAFGGTLGMEFTVNAPAGIIIRQLGAFDDKGDALPGDGIPTQYAPHVMRVSIYNKATRTVVPGLEVLIQGRGDEYVYNYRMKNVTPVTLPRGTYVLATWGYNAEERNGNADFGTPIIPGDNGGGAISYNRSLFNTNSGYMQYPDQEDAGPANKYLAGTFRYEVAPSAARFAAAEPAMLLQQKPEPAKSLNFKVSPNPSRGVFILQLSSLLGGKTSVDILNVQGAVLQQRSLELPGQNKLSSVPIDLLKQPTGTYLIRVRTAEGVQVQKVNVQR